MEHCLSEENTEELLSRLNIDGEELEKAAESLSIDFKPDHSPLDHDVEILIKMSMGTKARNLEEYRADVEEIAGALNLLPENTYVAVAIAWTAGQEEIDRGIASMKQERYDLAEGAYPCDIEGIPLPIVAVHKTDEQNRSIAVGD